MAAYDTLGDAPKRRAQTVVLKNAQLFLEWHVSCSLVSRERGEKIMNLILLVVVLVLLFGGGGYYWNSRRG